MKFIGFTFKVKQNKKKIHENIRLLDENEKPSCQC